MSEIAVPEWLFSKYPLVCTLCGGSFEYNGKRTIFPYPMKEYLCFFCFDKSMKAGLGRLNKVLAGQPLTPEDWQSPEKEAKVHSEAS